MPANSSWFAAWKYRADWRCEAACAGEELEVFITASNFFVSAINLGVYLYTPELYPTRVRALAVGTATAWLRLASMIGPTTVGFMIASGLNAVFLAFGVVTLVTAIVTALFAIETKKRVLEEISP